MITQEIDNIKINIITNINEWGKEFYDIPEDAILENTEDLEKECMGFSSIDDNEIWIYKSKNSSFEELLSVVSHELGHLITNGYKKNPPQTKRYNSKHELKAIHYENFVMKSYKITTILFNII